MDLQIEYTSFAYLLAGYSIWTCGSVVGRTFEEKAKLYSERERKSIPNGVEEPRDTEFEIFMPSKPDIYACTRVALFFYYLFRQISEFSTFLCEFI